MAPWFSSLIPADNCALCLFFAVICGFMSWAALKPSKARFGWDRAFLIARLVIARAVVHLTVIDSFDNFDTSADKSVEREPFISRH